jgi:hypothetical protein
MNCACSIYIGERRVAGLVEKAGRPRRRWEDNIKVDLQEVECVRTKLIWLRIRTGGGLLWVR